MPKRKFGNLLSIPFWDLHLSYLSLKTINALLAKVLAFSLQGRLPKVGLGLLLALSRTFGAALRMCLLYCLLQAGKPNPLPKI